MIKIIDKANKFIEYFAGILLAIMTISVFIQILVRFVFTYFNVSLSAPWTEELARYLMFWVVFLAGAVAVRKSRMIAMEALIPVVPERIGQIIKIFAHIVSIIFYGFIFVAGLEWAVTSGLSRTSTAMNIPMVFVYSAMFVGAILMILNTITLLIDSLLNKKDLRSLNEKM